MISQLIAASLVILVFLLLLALFIPLLWHWFSIRVIAAVVITETGSRGDGRNWLIKLQVGVTREPETRL